MDVILTVEMGASAESWVEADALVEEMRKLIAETFQKRAGLRWTTTRAVPTKAQKRKDDALS